MSITASAAGVGVLLREWRTRRRLSQLLLAAEADVSARHLSFVETGRAKPSREYILHLAEHMDVPLRERNALLLAAGFAPSYPQTPLDDAGMVPVREALGKILSGHEPFPALVVDRRFDVVTANGPALQIITQGVAPDLLTPPMNAFRATLHPDGLAPRIVNLSEWSAHLLDRVRRASMASGDPELAALYDELRSYPGVSLESLAGAGPETLLFVPFVLRTDDDQQLSFLSTMATFGTALDITLAELAIESFYPADESTGRFLHDSAKML